MKRRDGFTLVELLVVIAVIAVLVLLLLPAINAAREAARMAQCKNNIRSLGIALHNHETAKKRFPSGWVSHEDEADGHPGWGWGVYLLPFMEEEALYKQFELKHGIDEHENEEVRETVINVFLCPSDHTDAHVLLTGEPHDHDHDHASIAVPPTIASLGLTLAVVEDHDDHDDDDHDHDHEHEEGEPLFEVARSNYVGMFGPEEVHDHPYHGEGMFFRNSGIRVKDVKDGLSKTIALGERSSRLGGSVWVGVVPGGDHNMERVVGSADHTPNSPEGHFEDFSSHHPTGAHFCMGDGAVLLLTDDVDEEVYKALSTRAGAEVVLKDFTAE